MLDEFDFAAYFDRIGLTAAPSADAAGLSAVQRAHRLAIPFENLDIPLGRGVSLDPARVFAKLVSRRRGGYCFEQNQLFLRALHALGFTARPLLARVWLMAEGVPPRTHTLNLVTLDGQGWIADAGFGGSMTPPMPVEEGIVHTTSDGASHRLMGDARHGWMLERDGGDGSFQPQYSFTLEDICPADLVMSNHFTATMPATRFTTMRFVSRPTEVGFKALTDRRYTEGGSDRDIVSAADYRETLAEAFGIALSDEEVRMLGLFEGG